MARDFTAKRTSGVALWGRNSALAFSAIVPLFACIQTARAAAHDGGLTYDFIIRHGTIYDGSGSAPMMGDIAIKDGRIAHVGGDLRATATTEIDARDMAIAPGFINMLSWAVESLAKDPRGLSDIAQGVTLEIFGEGWSMGPLNDPMKKQLGTMFPAGAFGKGDWTTLGEYLEYLRARGVSPNVASFVGATTVRIHELGENDVDPDAAQLLRMRGLVRSAMEEGALGLGTSLIYAPASYAETPELTALASEAGRCGGMYISHMRSEGDRIEEAVDELISISKDAKIRSEIYHMKMAGTANWGKLDRVTAKIETARASGLAITADMYPYPAGGTALDASIPNWAHDGGQSALLERLRNPSAVERIMREMQSAGNGWENLYFLSGPENVRIQFVENKQLRPLLGKSIADISRERGTSPAQTVVDIVREDKGATQALYFMASEANLRRQVALPYMSFGSDAEAVAPEGTVLKSPTHPRTYGTFARVLGSYVRDEKLLTLSEAIRKVTSLPAANLRIRDRGALRAGFHADIVILDPKKIGDRASFAEPHQLAVGVRDVFVNGVAVMRNGQHTRATPGEVVRGPGWTGWPDGGACPRPPLHHAPGPGAALPESAPHESLKQQKLEGSS